MANHLAIAAVAKTMLKMVEDHCPRDEFAATPTFTLCGGHDFSSPQVTEGFSLLVWRIQPSAALRRSQPLREADGRKRLPSLAVDLSILMTAWAAEPERQLRLTGWLMRFFEDNAIVPAALLNHSLTERSVPAFKPEEAIELMLDPLTLPDHLGLWDKFRNRCMTSVNYSVRMLQMESNRFVDEGPLVVSRAFGAGEIAEGDRHCPEQHRRP
jgi:Pvc16 N-terminal domain